MAPRHGLLVWLVVLSAAVLASATASLPPNQRAAAKAVAATVGKAALLAAGAGMHCHLPSSPTKHPDPGSQEPVCTCTAGYHMNPHQTQCIKDTTSSSTSTSTSTAQGNDVGCWENDNKLSAIALSSPLASPQACFAACAAQNKPIAAAFSGNQCLCGDNPSAYGSLGPSKDCVSPCAADKQAFCGGSGSIQVLVRDQPLQTTLEDPEDIQLPDGTHIAVSRMLVAELQDGVKQIGAGYIFLAGRNDMLIKASAAKAVGQHLPRASDERFSSAIKKLASYGHGEAKRAASGCAANINALRPHVILAVPQDCAGGYFVRIDSISDLPKSDVAYKSKSPLGVIKKVVIDTNWKDAAHPTALALKQKAGKHVTPPVSRSSGGGKIGNPYMNPLVRGKRVRRDFASDNHYVSFLIEDSSVPGFVDEALDIKELTNQTISSDSSKEFSFGPALDMLLVEGQETCSVKGATLNSKLQVRLKGHTIVRGLYGVHIKGHVLPTPVVEENFIFFKAGGDAEIKMIVDADLSLSYEKVLTLLTSPAIGYTVPGILKAGLGLSIDAKFNADLVLSGHLEAGVRIDFPTVNLVYGQGDPNTSSQNSSDPGDVGTPKPLLAANVDIYGNAEVHIIPRAYLTLDILSGTVNAEIGAKVDTTVGLDFATKAVVAINADGSAAESSLDLSIYARCAVDLYAQGQLWNQVKTFSTNLYDSQQITVYKYSVSGASTVPVSPRLFPNHAVGISASPGRSEGTTKSAVKAIAQTGSGSNSRKGQNFDSLSKVLYHATASRGMLPIGPRIKLPVITVSPVVKGASALTQSSKALIQLPPILCPPGSTTDTPNPVDTFKKFITMVKAKYGSDIPGLSDLQASVAKIPQTTSSSNAKSEVKTKVKTVIKSKIRTVVKTKVKTNAKPVHA
ncbi:hypothetical protein HK405_011140 [Cladochytrium tenue]|nr:hypothetical protein HK405_011140 [Cladochytrium tenue]